MSTDNQNNSTRRSTNSHIYFKPTMFVLLISHLRIYGSFIHSPLQTPTGKLHNAQTPTSSNDLQKHSFHHVESVNQLKYQVYYGHWLIDCFSTYTQL
jgi:hypothetical protein